MTEQHLSRAEQAKKKYHDSQSKENQMDKKIIEIPVVKISVIVLIIAFVGLIIMGLIGLLKANDLYNKLSQDHAESVLGTMTYIGELKWESSHYNLQAVVYCAGNEKPIFIETSKSYEAETLKDCAYETAIGVRPIAITSFFSETGKIKFVPTE
jgi:hypothetical protein